MNEIMFVATHCPFCGKDSEIKVEMDDFFAWQDGVSTQNAFPYLSADEREQLISGICPNCWEKMFAA